MTLPASLSRSRRDHDLGLEAAPPTVEDHGEACHSGGASPSACLQRIFTGRPVGLHVLRRWSVKGLLGTEVYYVC